MKYVWLPISITVLSVVIFGVYMANKFGPATPQIAIDSDTLVYVKCPRDDYGDFSTVTVHWSKPIYWFFQDDNRNRIDIRVIPTSGKIDRDHDLVVAALHANIDCYIGRTPP